jgi:hypothetical protein
MKKGKQVKEFNFDEKVPELKIVEIKISLNEYLSKYNNKRVLDNVIRHWCSKKDNLNPKKTIEEWNKLIEEFHNETER